MTTPQQLHQGKDKSVADCKNATRMPVSSATGRGEFDYNETQNIKLTKEQLKWYRKKYIDTDSEEDEDEEIKKIPPPEPLTRQSRHHEPVPSKRGRKSKYTQEEFIQKLILCEPRYDYSQVIYTSVNKKITITCNNKHTFDIRANSFLSDGNRCKKCFLNKKKGSKQIKWNQELLITKIQEKYTGYDTTAVQFTNLKTKIQLTCNKGHTYKILPNTIIYNRPGYCPTCKQYNMRNKQEEVIKYIKEQEPGYDTSKIQYETANKKIIFICDKNHEYKCTYNSFYQGSRCPKCKNSKMEKECTKYLNEMQINHETQKVFLINKRKRYIFDIHIPQYNLYIELDGEQHFQFVQYFHKTKQNFNKQKQRDQEKTNYIIQVQKGTLIRISYKDKLQMKEILQKYVKDYTNETQVIYSTNYY